MGQDNFIFPDTAKDRLDQIGIKLGEIRAACYDMLKELKEIKKHE